LPPGPEAPDSRVVRYLLLIPALAATLAAAGCGSGSKNDYVQSVNEAQASLQKSLSSLSGINASSTGAQVATTLQKGGDALDDAADDFSDIKPPDDAEHAHGQMVDGLHKLAGTFHEAAKSAKSAKSADDFQAVAKVLTDLTTSEGAKELQAAEDELKANGYKFKSS
jgi:multidrug resistance efflux pump